MAVVALVTPRTSTNCTRHSTATAPRRMRVTVRAGPDTPSVARATLLASKGEPMSFHDLHVQPEPLLLPTAWDAGSAIAFAAAGFPAVGTTSFGVNASTGRPDAGGASREATVALVHRLRSLPVYLTADIEDGYSDDPGEVAALVAGLGVAGVNLEDSADGRLVDPAIPAAKFLPSSRSGRDRVQSPP